MPLDNKGLEVGQIAPQWELKGTNGRAVSLASLRGRPVLLFFFRGTWCPSCRRQMEQIRDEWERIEPLTQVVSIVGQEEAPVREFLERTPLPYPLLCDPNRKVIEAHNVYQKFGLSGFRIAHPTTLIIDSVGIVRYCYVGSSQFDRPDLEEVIRELQVLTTLKIQ
jgi:peroxiredoxin Q/BCP